jgi:hypothetical protein
MELAAFNGLSARSVVQVSVFTFSIARAILVSRGSFVADSTNEICLTNRRALLSASRRAIELCFSTAGASAVVLTEGKCPQRRRRRSRLRLSCSFPHAPSRGPALFRCGSRCWRRGGRRCLRDLPARCGCALRAAAACRTAGAHAASSAVFFRFPPRRSRDAKRILARVGWPGNPGGTWFWTSRFH